MVIPHKTDLSKPTIKKTDVTGVEGFLKGAKGNGNIIIEDKENKPDKISTFLLRIPSELRKQIKVAAVQAGIDMNTYITQCLEDKIKGQ
ncbi:MAG TPA: hypothetical protein DD713_00965 [Nitrospiraceae bacterium]|nr:hypothetical protein [Nitrospiraceae bacterium]